MAAEFKIQRIIFREKPRSETGLSGASPTWPLRWTDRLAGTSQPVPLHRPLHL